MKNTINNLKAKVSNLVNTVNDRNEKILPKTFLIFHDSPSHIDEELWYIGDYDQDSISPQSFELN